MDVFDSEPYLGLVPKRVLQPLALVALIAIAYCSPARAWFIEQATIHARHEIQPIVDDMLRPHTPVPPSAPASTPGETSSPR